jgi:hypothetical protein
MTDQDLIAWLLDQETDLADCAVDRIEALTKERDTAREYAGEVRIREKVADDARIEAEAKLTKTVEALRDTTRMLSQCTFTIIRMGGQYFERHEVVDKANAVLAELEVK